MRFLHQRLLISRFVLAIGVYQACRVLFLVFNFRSFSNESFASLAYSFLWGTIFDISTFVYFNGIFILLHLIPIPGRNDFRYQRVLKWLFVISNTIVVFLNAIDFAYFRFSGKRSGTDLFTGANNIGSVWTKYIADYFYLVIIVVIIAWLITKLYPKFKTGETVKDNRLTELFFLLLFTGLSIIGARGTGLRPLRSFDAAKYVDPQLVPLLLNTPFQVISTLQTTYQEEPHFMSEESAEKIYSPVQQFRFDENNRKNVVILILESFGKEYIGYFNDGKGYTPFLDSLAEESLVFSNALANGKRSNEAIPAILSSLPSLTEKPWLNTPYAYNSVNTLGSLLRKDGYYSAFYHGGHNGTMAFDNYLMNSGNGDYYGMDEYPDKKDYDGSWGVYDEPYLHWFCNELDKKQKPFCVSLFTVSSHHPYSIPDSLKDKLPNGPLPIHKAVAYTDRALKRFFREASKKQWYRNTIFVITADHSAENMKQYYLGMYGKYAIPLLFFEPGDGLRGTDNRLASQADIMPSVLDLVHYNRPFYAFGRSLFRDYPYRLAAQFDNGTYQVEVDDKVTQFSGNNLTGLYQVPPDSLLSNNLINSEMPWKRNVKTISEAFLQVYFHYLNKGSLQPKLPGR